MTISKQQQEVEQWLDDVVIGLNLCPFAAQPRRNNQIRLTVSHALTPEVLVADLYDELSFMAHTEASEVETSLLIVPDMLLNFDDYNEFLDIADGLLIDNDWEGVFQIASFHPDYCFADTQADSVDNLTNRAPYPILHIIREDSLSKALDNMASPDEVYKRNIRTVNHLTPEQIHSLFPHLIK
jgi:hypothetical protein